MVPFAEMENTGKELVCGEGLCVGTRCFSGGSIKNVPVIQETWVRSQETLGWEDPLKKGMATHSNILAWRIPWTEQPWALQSMGLQRVEHDLVIKQHR